MDWRAGRTAPASSSCSGSSASATRAVPRRLRPDGGAAALQGRRARAAAAPRVPRSSPPPPPPPPKKSADLEAVEAERDLYVTKLRDVERRVQTRPADESAAELALAITRILYDNGSAGGAARDADAPGGR